jgi:hypothetical protein
LSDSIDKTTTGLKRVVNYKILLLIAGLAIIYQTFNYILPEKEGEFSPIDVVLPVVNIVCAIFAFIVARKYSSWVVLGPAYTALGIGFALYSVGEIIWHYYSIVLKIYPYPSLADIFYFAYYPFTIFHMVRNIKFFRPKIGIRTITWLVGIPVAILLLYSYFTFQQDEYSLFDYYYGLIFVTAATIRLSLAILGTQVFKKSVLASVWSLLALGVFINTAGDVYYYYLEIFGLYTETHLLNALWFAAPLIITYALYKHLKIKNAVLANIYFDRFLRQMAKPEFEQDLKQALNQISKKVEIDASYKTELKKEDLVKLIGEVRKGFEIRKDTD